MFQKNYFEEEILNPLDSNSGGFNTLATSPVKAGGSLKVDMQSTIKGSSNNNGINSSNDEEVNLMIFITIIL
jgi:hypothetical protein